MIGGLSSGLAGFKAASERLENSVNNIANKDSTVKLEKDGSFSNEPYRPQTVQPVSQAEGGVGTVTTPRDPATISRFEPSSVVADENGFVQAPNVDLAQEIIEQTIASYDAQANLKSIKVADELFESVLDIFT